MGEAAVKAANAIGYDNAGTVEFIVAPDLSFYFLEVNTRLQVEHPVTEMVTGFDLVRLQIEVAEGKTLPFKQEEISQQGHAVEVRIYAEDPANNFMPVNGKILHWHEGRTPGVRYDSAIESGSIIDIYYDPMIAKVIAHGKDRCEAIRKMQKALSELVVAGMTTNKDFLIAILKNEQFRVGEFDTHFLDKVFQYQGEKPSQEALDISTAALQLFRWKQREENRTLAKGVPSGWRNNFFIPQSEKYAYHGFEFEVQYTASGNTLQISFAGKTFKAVYITADNGGHVMEINGVRRTFYINQSGKIYFIQSAGLGQVSFQAVARYPEPLEETIKGGYTAPMPGEVTKVLVSAGQEVKSGDALIVMISMKMESTIEATEDGVVDEVFVEPKQFVEAGTLMLKLKD
jgi:acetyl/propionyl-CoA carboxylase alpha subunit